MYEYCVVVEYCVVRSGRKAFEQGKLYVEVVQVISPSVVTRGSCKGLCFLRAQSIAEALLQMCDAIQAFMPVNLVPVLAVVASFIMGSTYRDIGIQQAWHNICFLR